MFIPEKCPKCDSESAWHQKPTWRTGYRIGPFRIGGLRVRGLLAPSDGGREVIYHCDQCGYEGSYNDRPETLGRWCRLKARHNEALRACWRGISGSKKNQVNQGFSWDDIEGCHPFFSLVPPTWLVHFLYIIGCRGLKNRSKPPNLVHPKSCTIWQVNYSTKPQAFQHHLRYKLQLRLMHLSSIFITSLNHL